MKLRGIVIMAVKIKNRLQRRKEKVYLTTFTPKSKNEPYEESSWDIYQCLLHKKQVKEEVECNTQASPNMELVKAIAIENPSNPIQSELELEEIIVETVEWEKEVESERSNI